MRALRWVVACAVVIGCAPREEFCSSNVSCPDASCEPQDGSCITFEEASELAADPYAGVHTLTVRREPADLAAAIPYAQNDDAICRGSTCYLRRQGEVAIHAVPSPGQRFVRWSGCSDSTNPSLQLGNLRADSECVAHFQPLFVTVNAVVFGWYGQYAELTSSSGCQGPNSCVTDYGGSMTVSVLENPVYRFTGWSGCSASKEHTITLTNLTQSVECLAVFDAIRHRVSWSWGAGGVVNQITSGPDWICTVDGCDVVQGDQLVLLAEPEPGYTFAGWSCSDESSATLLLRNITQPIDCVASFASAQ